MEGDGIDGGAQHSSPGPQRHQGAPSNPPTMSEEDMLAFLRRRHFESTRRLLPALRQLGFSVRLVRPTTGGGFWQAAAAPAAAAAEMAPYGNGGFGAVPASSEAAARLPETTAREAGDQRECGVCLDEFADGDKLRAMPCSHGFHEGCIVRWLGISRLCPLCRFALPAAEASRMNGI